MVLFLILDENNPNSIVMDLFDGVRVLVLVLAL